MEISLTDDAVRRPQRGRTNLMIVNLRAFVNPIRRLETDGVMPPWIGSRVSVYDRIEDGEQRWRTIGWVEGLILVMVAHTVREEREDGTSIEIVRIISARHATRKERRRYEEENN